MNSNFKLHRITISILFSIMAISIYALSPMERYGRTQESLPLLTTEQLKNPVTQNLETKMHWAPANTNMLNLVNGVNVTTGSYIYGFMYSPYPQKWKEIRTDNAQEVFLWNANGFYLTNCFERKGYLEGFSFEVIPGGYMFYHRTYTLDGEAVSEITHTSVSKTESWKAPVRLAYDPFEDICYGFAENPNTAVKSYYFIKMNPETFEIAIRIFTGSLQRANLFGLTVIREKRLCLWKQNVPQTSCWVDWCIVRKIKHSFGNIVCLMRTIANYCELMI
jgi:hypothetical protein